MLNCFPTKMIVSQENSNQVIKSILIPGGQNIECNYIVSNLDYFPSKLRFIFFFFFFLKFNLTFFFLSFF